MTTIVSTNQNVHIRQLSKKTCLKSNRSLDKSGVHRKICNLCQSLIPKQGVYSTSIMKGAGFHYTGNGDTVRCNACGLEVSNWKLDMKPFSIHAERNPTCSFVLSFLSIEQTSPVSTSSFTSSTSTLNNEERLCKRQEIETTKKNCPSNILSELESLRQVRQRTFSHWPHRTSPSSAQMIEAGFFSCNVGDRVICLYCNLVCQQWTPYTDDPCEIHKTLSPKCPYVIANLTSPPVSSIPIVNASSTCSNPINDNSVACEQIVSTDACHAAYREIPKRYASFNKWSNECSPSVDDLVRAGFFYTGAQTIVTCFYCNGSLQNWAATDNPTMEHARWFPHCAYVKQLCGDKEYRKIQLSNQRRKELQEKNQSNKESQPSIGNSSGGRLKISDESTLTRYVAARLDLPISQSMLNRNFKLAIVKRCWEDQLRLKGDDFTSDIDLFIACTILQKQIECINGMKENIIVPSVAMNKIREKELGTSEPILVESSNDTDVEMSSSLTSSTSETSTRSSSSSNVGNNSDMKSNSTINLTQENEDKSSPLNPCALCLTEEKCLAFVPCGHVAACVSCGHSLRSCPICRTEIKAFVRVYL